MTNTTKSMHIHKDTCIVQEVTETEQGNQINGRPDMSF